MLIILYMSQIEQLFTAIEENGIRYQFLLDIKNKFKENGTLSPREIESLYRTLHKRKTSVKLLHALKLKLGFDHAFVDELWESFQKTGFISDKHEGLVHRVFDMLAPSTRAKIMTGLE